jgi:hypothetical protein
MPCRLVPVALDAEKHTYILLFLSWYVQCAESDDSVCGGGMLIHMRSVILTVANSDSGSDSDSMLFGR